MKLRILSDLHIEHYPLHLKGGVEDVVVLAGDIYLKAHGIKWALENFGKEKHIIYVPGNHEFYNQGEISETMQTIWDVCKKFDNVHPLVVPGDSCVIDGVRFIGGTLWTDFMLHGIANETASKIAAMRGLNDYYCIEDMGTAMTAQKTQQLHREFLDGMAQNYGSTLEEKVVVVTHMAPSSQSCHRKYVGDPLNPAYASRLEDWILDRPRIKAWFHGHVHNTADYQIGDCHVVANPRGYASFNKQENPTFNPNLIIEV